MCYISSNKEYENLQKCGIVKLPHKIIAKEGFAAINGNGVDGSTAHKIGRAGKYVT